MNYIGYTFSGKFFVSILRKCQCEHCKGHLFIHKDIGWKERYFDFAEMSRKEMDGEDVISLELEKIYSALYPDDDIIVNVHCTEKRYTMKFDEEYPFTDA